MGDYLYEREGISHVFLTVLPTFVASGNQEFHAVSNTTVSSIGARQPPRLRCPGAPRQLLVRAIPGYGKFSVLRFLDVGTVLGRAIYLEYLPGDGCQIQPGDDISAVMRYIDPSASRATDFMTTSG